MNMSKVDLAELRKSLVNGDNEGLKQIFLDYKADCISFLKTKKVTNPELATDHYIFADDLP